MFKFHGTCERCGHVEHQHESDDAEGEVLAAVESALDVHQEDVHDPDPGFYWVNAICWLCAAKFRGRYTNTGDDLDDSEPESWPAFLRALTQHRESHDEPAPSEDWD